MFEKRFTFRAAFLTVGIFAVLKNLVQSSKGIENFNAEFGESCNLTKCAKSLHCTDGICKCPNPDYEIYDTSADACRSRVGTKCGVGLYKCVHGADCTESKCRCKLGYVWTKQGTCGKPYGGTCIQKHDICVAPFVCREGKICGCRNAVDLHSNKTQICHTPVGYPCLYDYACVAGSRCKLSNRKGRSYKGTCECKIGFKPDQSLKSCILTACKTNLFRPVTEIANITAFQIGNIDEDNIPLYSCRVKINKTFAVGMARYGSGSKQRWVCSYEIEGAENLLYDNGFEVLAKPTNETELIWITGNRTSGFPEQALLADGKNQYVVRCKIMHGTEIFVPGRLVASHPRTVLFTWGDKARKCKNYEILVCSNRQQ